MPTADAPVLNHLHDAAELIDHGRRSANDAVFDLVDHHDDDAEHRQLGLDDQFHDDDAIFVQHAVQHHVEHDHAVGKHFVVDDHHGAVEVISGTSDRPSATRRIADLSRFREARGSTGLDFALSSVRASAPVPMNIL